jgi:hypothetical protein
MLRPHSQIYNLQLLFPTMMAVHVGGQAGSSRMLTPPLGAWLYQLWTQ